VDDIKHVLVLATPMTVRLVGIAKPPNASLGFYLTDLEANTNGIHMSCITATASGRIFMAGSDGHLYELDYRLSSGWFKSSSSCTLKNHTGSAWAGSLTPWMKSTDANHIIRITIDSSRNYLYTMAKNGTLELYWLGSDGQQPPQPQARLPDPASAAALLLPNNPMLDPHSFSIVSIFALTQQESKRFGLVGITSTGVRLYFIFRLEGAYYSSGLCLKLAHVRVPPQNPAPQNPRPSAAFYAPNPQAPSQALTTAISMPSGKVDAAWSGPGGLFIASHSPNADSDILVLTVPDVGKLSQAALSNQAIPFREAAGAIQIEGPTQQIVEIGGQAQAAASCMNELVVQATAAPRAFLVLTKRSLNVLVRSRPLDILAALLERAQENNQELLHFFEACVPFSLRID
jgi:nuclear pore complex protein Nup155